MPNLTTLVAALRLKNHPVCMGVLPVTTSALALYYGKTFNAKRINFADASAEELEHLSSSCVPATFGLNKEDVLDESYRKAGKMSAEEFSPKFDLAGSGLLDVVSTKLLEDDDVRDTMRIEHELYNLNVYGEGSFFKAHKDTPHNVKMLGSLVIVLPSAHVGGTLIVRHGGQEWEFDSGKLLRHAPSGSPAIAYAAFFSDVEHEVLPVTSGYRVSITYNLYYPDSAKPVPIPAPEVISRLPFYIEFSGLLADPTFVPEGHMIGFGLSHKYPVTVKTALSEIVFRLKGQDAVIYKVCRILNLNPQLRVVYHSRYGYREILYDRFVDLDGYRVVPGNFAKFLEERGEECIILSSEEENEVVEEDKVIWVIPPTDLTRVEQHYMAYGNQAELVTQYADVCLITELPALGERLEILKSLKAAGEPEPTA